MPRYFFPTTSGAGTEPDVVGVELRDLDEARDCAVRALVELARDVLEGDSPARVLAIEVRDEDGRLHFQGRLIFEPGAEN